MHLIRGCDRTADHLLRRNTISVFCKHTHKLNAATGHDVGGKALIPQIAQQFHHRLIGHLIIAQARLGVACPFQPRSHILLELIKRHFGVRGRQHFQKPFFAGRRQRFVIPGGSSTQRITGQNRRILRGQLCHLIHRKNKLEINRLLRPERAVIVKCRNPVSGGDIVLRRRVCHRFHKGDNPGLRLRVVPGRQWICQRHSRRNCHSAHNKGGHMRKFPHHLITPTKSEKIEAPPRLCGMACLLVDHRVGISRPLARSSSPSPDPG